MHITRKCISTLISLDTIGNSICRSLSHQLVHWKWCRSLISISERSVYMWRFGYDQHSTPIETLTQQCTYSPISVRCIIQLSIPVSTSANGFSLITSNRLLKHSNGLADFISAPRLPRNLCSSFSCTNICVFTEYWLYYSHPGFYGLLYLLAWFSNDKHIISREVELEVDSFDNRIWYIRIPLYYEIVNLLTFTGFII